MKFVNWAECYFTIPMVMVAYPTAAITGWDNWDASWLVGIKNSHTQLIDSMSVDIQNSSVLQLTRYTNIYTTYRMLTTMSKDELSNIAPSLGFFPDTSDSFGYSAAASPSGRGSTNNLVWGFEKLYPNNGGVLYSNESVAAGAWSISALQEGRTDDVPVYNANSPSSPSIKTLANVGLYQRMKSLVYNPNIAPYSSLLNEDSCKTLLKSYYKSQLGGLADAGYKIWTYMAKIRLKDVSSVFEQMGLLRGVKRRPLSIQKMGKSWYNTMATSSNCGNPLKVY